MEIQSTLLLFQENDEFSTDIEMNTKVSQLSWSEFEIRVQEKQLRNNLPQLEQRILLNQIRWVWRRSTNQCQAVKMDKLPKSGCDNK